MEKNKSQKAQDEYKNEFLNFKLDVLKLEMQYIEETIARIDGITQATKNWAIGIWTGSIALALQQTEFRSYIILTAIIPIIFWFIDAQWKSFQRRSSYRLIKISEFLNSEDLVGSFKKKEIINFTILDPVGSSHRKDEQYQKFTSLYRILKFKEVRILYLGLAAISIVLGSYFIVITS